MFGPDTSSPGNIIRTLFERLRKHILKLSPAKIKLGATEAELLVSTIFPSGASPNADKVDTLTSRSLPTDVKQLHSLIGGNIDYHKFIANMSTCLRSVSAPSSNKVSGSVEGIIRQLLHELATPSTLGYPTGIPSPATLVLSVCTLTPVTMALAGLSSKRNRTAESPRRVHQSRHTGQRTLLDPSISGGK